MKYVVKMDYCTMAFTSGTCSLQALSNCLAGDTDLHWVQIYNSEKSPYHGAYLAVVESISKLIASGAKFEDVYLTFQEYFEKPMKDGKRWGKPLAVAIILLGLIASFIPAAPFMIVGGMLPSLLTPGLTAGLSAIGAPQFIIGLICDVGVNALYFAISMIGFVFGITLVFGFILTKIGYANIWPLFGSANQLLSALVLATLCVFLKVTGRSNKMLFPPLIIMLCVTFTALVQRLIAMVKAISTAASVTIPAGETTWGAVFIANGLQLILAVLLIVLGLNIVVHSFKAYQKAEQNSEVKV